MNKSKAISVRLNDEQIARLGRAAQKAGRHGRRWPQRSSRKRSGSRVPLRQFRDWGAGAGVPRGHPTEDLVGRTIGTRLGGDAYVAKNWNLRDRGERAVAYAEAFPDEMEAAERANDVSLEELKRKLPNLECFVDLTAADAPAP